MGPARRGGESGWAPVIQILALLTALSVALPAGQLLAHGGGTARLVDEPVGPYRLYVWTRPEPIRVGTAHITVGVFTRDPETEQEEPVPDARIELVFLPRTGGSGWRGEASREESVNKLYYEADWTIAAEGEWDARVMISGPAGAGEAAFAFTAVGRGINWMVVGGAAILAIVLGWWFLGSKPPEAAGGR